MRSFEQQLQKCLSQLQEYRSTNMQLKLKAQLEKVERDKEHLEDRVAGLEAKISKLNIATVVSKPQTPGYLATYITGTVKPIGTTFTMTDFEEYKIDNDRWYFYTHPNGYKMCVRICANGNGPGQGTHLSVYVSLMQGEFDDQLKWPFQGIITVKLLNQEEDKDHVTKTVKFIESEQQEDCQRVTTDGPSTGQGYGQFLPHTKLQPKYLKNDCIKLCIKKVEVF
jgi:TNF receptor-associated factor 4